MTPLQHNVVVIASVAVFAIAAWLAPQPDPVWKRIVSVGLALLALGLVG